MSDHDEILLMMLYLVMATVTESALMSLLWFGLALVQFVTAWRSR